MSTAITAVVSAILGALVLRGCQLLREWHVRESMGAARLRGHMLAAESWLGEGPYRTAPPPRPSAQRTARPWTDGGRTSPTAAGPGPQPPRSPQQAAPPRARARARVPVDEGVPLASAASAGVDAVPLIADPDHARAFVAATRPSLVEPCPCGSARRCWRHTAIAICRTVREDELYRVVGGGDA